MPDDRYSLSDLARLADVTPRTIRYYVAQGLLPSPAAAGPATRYGEGHLARLRVIKRLQRDHLPLAEIRARLAGLTDEEVQAALDSMDLMEPEPEIRADATLAFVRDLMARSSVTPQHRMASAAPRERAALADMRPAPGQAFAPAPASASASPAPAPAESAPSMPGQSVFDSPSYLRRSMAPPAQSPSPRSDRSTWERIALSPDVELHVRRPLDRHSNKRLEKLLQIALDLFRDGP